MSLSSLCKTAGFLRVLYFLNIVLDIIFILVPIIIIVTVVIKLGNVVFNGKEDQLKETFVTSIKKVVAGLIIFMLPNIIDFAFSLTGESFAELKTCTANATTENIKYYDSISNALAALSAMEQNPTNTTVEKAENAISKITSIAREDDYIDFLTRISDAKIKANENQLILECKKKNGKYQNGFCTTVTLEENTHPNQNNGGNGGGGSGDTSYDPALNGGGTTQINVLGGDFTVVNTQIPVVDYVNSLKRRRVSQNADTSKYGDKCLGFAYTHGWGLYSNNTSYTADQGANYAGAGNFTTYINDSKQDVLSKVFNEVVNGRPVILQVNGNKQGTSRHFVTVVGFKSSVTNANSITEQDLLIIDSWDANLERMDTEGSRFMTSGADCHKDYSGYRIQYLKG